MRGNFNLMQLSSKRSIRSMDHFSELEEYFDGDPGMQQAIGPRAVKREVTNRMGDLNAILDYPPAPKLNPLMRLNPAIAAEAELRGEKLFLGKAECAKCHSGPAFVDDCMHDLRVERFYAGRPEGTIETFPLRGIKDSPPYLHDGRCPTRHDAVEFFNLVLELKLSRQEKDDLVAYLLCLQISSERRKPCQRPANELAQMIDRRSHHPSGSCVAEHLFDAEMARKGGAAAGFHG